MLTYCPHTGGDVINELTLITHQPFDYQYLNGILRNYRYPRNKINKMLKSQDIIALKRGLYILSDIYGKNIVKASVANLLYGPSYVSLDYALAYYGLIPEFAYNLTSVTSSRKKIYRTAIGTFSYRQLKTSYYSQGYTIRKSNDTSFLIATPEKALCDKLYLSPGQQDTDMLARMLFEELRIEPEYLRDMNKKHIIRYAETALNNNVNLLIKIVAAYAK